MPTFEFSLVISGLDHNDIEDRLFEAGCDDALVAVIKGQLVLDFSREAKSYSHALASASAQIHSVGGRVTRKILKTKSRAAKSGAGESSGPQ